MTEKTNILNVQILLSKPLSLSLATNENYIINQGVPGNTFTTLQFPKDLLEAFWEIIVLINFSFKRGTNKGGGNTIAVIIVCSCGLTL